MRASVVTLGCKVNEYESQSIMNQLKQAGYEIFEGLVPADVYVVNTCAVTNTGEKKSKQVLAKLEKLNPNAKIVVCGCAVQNNPAKFLGNPNVIALTGNNGKNRIMEFINNQNKVLPDLEHAEYDDMPRPIETRTRQYIKIQDGCNYFCSYCLIPYVRGRSRSRDMNDILAEIKETKASEIVLTGINMSDYRIDGKLALAELIKNVDMLGKRFRISSIECNILDDEMFAVLKNCKNFCPHFHLSLQSACNDTLKRMNRRYTIEKFIEITDRIKKEFPSACISTDLIVGFKGESDQEFEDTFKNLKRIGFDFMHIFPYSVRSGTVASRMGGDVDPKVVKERERRLQQLNAEFKQKFFKKNANTAHKLLVEIVDENYSIGYTDNYIYTYLPAKYEVGEIVDITLKKPYKKGMLAE